MKILTLITALFLIATITQAKSNAPIDNLFKAMDMEQTMKKSIEHIVDEQVKADPVIKNIETKYRAFMHDIMGWKVMKPKLVYLYNKYYTQQDINDLAKFYNTPVGKKNIRITPELSAENVKIIKNLMLDNLDKIRSLVK